MMESARAWLLGVVLTALAGGLARQLAPQGKEQSMVRLVSGLLLALAILRPLAGSSWDGPELPAGNFSLQSREQAEIYRKNQQEAFSAIIEQKAEAYILDKANRLGLACRVQVTAAAGESGIPLPSFVTVKGAYSAELAKCIEEEVGIPAQNQIWLEDETWQTTKEN